MNTKEREREELHKTIWKIANELRGSVDGWDFKQYVLGLLFYRFISENIENYVNENQRKAGITDFQYRDISDEEALLGKSQILDEKGFFILPSELFCNIRKGADKNENLNGVISNVYYRGSADIYSGSADVVVNANSLSLQQIVNGLKYIHQHGIIHRNMNLSNILTGLFIFHQANVYMLEFLKKKLKVESERFYYYIENVVSLLNRLQLFANPWTIAR